MQLKTFLILDLTSRHLKGWRSALVKGGLWQRERADDVQPHTFVQLFHWFFSAKAPSDLWSGTWITGLFHVMWQIQLLFKQTLAGQTSLSADRRTFRSTQWQTPRTEALLWPLHTASKAFHQLHFLSLFPPVEPPSAPSFLLHLWGKKSQKLTAAQRREDRRPTKTIKISHPKTKKMEDYQMRSLEPVALFASASILSIKYLTHISSVQHHVCH